jgi:hypothetical protein
MSVISAGTTLTTALVQTGDTNGNLVFRTGASGTTALTLGSDQSATFAGAVSFGSSAFGLGSAGAPSITFTGDTNTGIFSPGADTIAFTEGGVESMRINSSGNLGIGTVSPAFGLVVEKDNGSGYVAGFRNASGSPMLTIQNTGGISQIQGLNSALSATANIAMQVSGGNVGIGTNNPSQRLHVASAGTTGIQVQNTASTGSAYLQSTNTATSAYYGVDATGGYIETSGAYSTVFYTNSAERLRITSSGQIGAGTTSFQTQSPAGSISIPGLASFQTGSFGRAWNPGQQIGGIFSSGRYGMAYTYLAYYDAGWKSLGGGVASAITIDEGIFSFSNTNSVGGSGSALTWTTRLAVDTSGNLQFNSGYGSAAIAYGCRAWVNFNGTGTPAIRASGNMSSITDDGTGQYRANFTNAMPDLNFAVVGSAAAGTTYGGYHITSAIGNDSTGSARVWTGWTNGAADQGWVYIAVFR